MNCEDSRTVSSRYCFLTLLTMIVLNAYPSAQGETSFSLALVADEDTRFYDLLSGAFAQIVPAPPEPIIGSHEDGYFSIAAEPGYPLPYNSRTFDIQSFEPTEFIPIGDGIPDDFPNERHFQSDYSVTYDENLQTGVGHENSPLTSAELDFNSDFAAGDLLGIVGYLTEAGAVSGEVHLIDGQVAGITALIDVTFVYDFSQWGYLTRTEFHGSLALEGRRWALFVDDLHDPSELNLEQALRVIWDGHGYVSNLYETGLPGDYNNDGVVNAADYTVWRDNLGAREGTLPNDVDGGDITSQQYLTWRSNFGATALEDGAGSFAGHIPEPTAVSLVGLAISLSLVGRRYRVWRV